MTKPREGLEDDEPRRLSKGAEMYEFVTGEKAPDDHYKPVDWSSHPLFRMLKIGAA